jgi:hypothetical protein
VRLPQAKLICINSNSPTFIVRLPFTISQALAIGRASPWSIASSLLVGLTPPYIPILRQFWALSLWEPITTDVGETYESSTWKLEGGGGGAGSGR